MRIVIAILIGLFLMGCGPVTEQSKVLKEKVRVVALVYNPGVHDSSVGPTINFNGGVGIGISSIDVPPYWAVVFECQHGRFIVEDKALWKAVYQDSVYTCLYTEIYKTEYKNDVVISRVLVKYDFLGLEEFPQLLHYPDKHIKTIGD